MKPIRTEIPFATPWFEVVAKTICEEEAPYYSLRLPDYAATVAVCSDGKVLLVRQYRPAVERVTLELPSGLVDPGESPVEAARRELLEETGWTGGEFESLGPFLPDTGRLGNRIWCCVARGLVRDTAREPEAGIEVVRFSLDDLMTAVRDGRFDHALHVAALMVAVAHGKLMPLTLSGPLT